MKINSVFGKCIGIMLFCVFFVFMGCDTGTTSTIPGQKRVAITDIPSTFNNYYGIVGLFDSNINLVAMSWPPQRIARGRFTGNLEETGSFSPFTGDGNYRISLSITTDGHHDNIVWFGLTQNFIGITQETTSLSFTAFFGGPRSIILETSPLMFYMRDNILPEIAKKHETINLRRKNDR